jgi:FeS assembly protein IscX
MLWTDVNEIAIELAENHPDIDPTYILFTDLRRLVMELEGFIDSPEKTNEKILETIQMLWIEERE